MNTMRLYAVLSSLDINSSGNEKKNRTELFFSVWHFYYLFFHVKYGLQKKKRQLYQKILNWMELINSLWMERSLTLHGKGAVGRVGSAQWDDANVCVCAWAYAYAYQWNEWKILYLSTCSLFRPFVPLSDPLPPEYLCKAWHSSNQVYAVMHLDWAPPFALFGIISSMIG